ncbi:hypothetical protein [Rhizobium leguminosarum]|uniref:hypothetical protein n=1 Tax=Rhizobium leguminosarum TaxID=384 RepID=UPI00103AB3CB|nr:hypothetical protein [Rhizobium leguminosarum]TBZ13958.1 hypothetical protein E0H33_17750 [Rhizobium leguminosarum bv. viciae]
MSIHQTILLFPGKITQEANIHAELRNVPQWILWELIPEGPKLKKYPRDWRDPKYNVSAHDKKYWTTFENAVAVMRADPEGRFGIGFVLDGSGYLCIDLDDHAGADQEAVKRGQELVDHVLAVTGGTYAETSLQRAGKHVFLKATLPHGRTYGDLTAHLNIEVYAAGFIAITGKVLSSWPTPIADGQAIVDEWQLPPPVANIGSVEKTETLGRRLDLPDKQVIETLMVRRLASFKTLATEGDLVERSDAFAYLVGDLDKITGDPEQIDRIIRKAPVFKSSHNSSRYERRTYSFEHWVRLARATNKESIPYTEFITRERRVFLESIASDISRRTRAPLPPEVIAQQEVPADELAGLTNDLLCGLPEHVSGHDAFEHLVDCSERGSKKPFRLFSEIATIGAFGALLARKFKSTDGTSTMPMEMLIAKTGSGKGEAFNYWASHISKRATPDSPSKIVAGPASSAEALHGLIQKTGSTLWIRADGDADVQMLAKPTDANQKRFRNYVYEMFDASRYGQAPMAPPESIAAQKRGDQPIHNACCSLLWSTTPHAFAQVYDLDVLSTGLGSRAIITVHDTHSGELVPDSQVVKELDSRANNILNQVHLLADEIDTAYRRSATDGDSYVRQVGYDQEAAEFIWTLEQKQTAIHRKVDDNEYPPHYAVFLRTSMLTKKLALLSALIRFFDLPQRETARPIITKKDVEWGLARVVRSMRTLAKMFDDGKLGKGGDAARRAAFKVWVLSFVDPKKPPRDRRITQEMLDSRIIPYWWLNGRAGKTKVFADHPYGTDNALKATIANLISEGVFAEVSAPAGGKRYQLIDAELL